MLNSAIPCCAYSSETLNPAIPCCAYSSDTLNPAIPCYAYTSETLNPAILCLYSRAFPVAAARAWNALPLSVRAVPSLLLFRRELRTTPFRASYA